MWFKHDKLPIVYNSVSRRMFLQGMGSLFSIPFLPSLVPNAEAQSYQDHCFIFSHFTHGRNVLGWNPYLPGVWEQPGLQDVGNGVKAMPLSQIRKTPNGDWSDYLRKDLFSIQDKINIIQGIDSNIPQSHLHFPYHASTRDPDLIVPNHPHVNDPQYPWSVDARIGSSNKFYKTTPAINVLRIDPGRGSRRMSSYGHQSGTNGDMNWAQNYTGKTVDQTWNFIKYKLNPTYSGGGGELANNGVSKGLLRRKFLVDQFFNQYKAVENSSNLAASEKNVLDNAVSNLTDLQRRINSQVDAARDAAGGNSEPLPIMQCPSADTRDPRNNVELNRRMIEMMTIAMACGATRIATYQMNWNTTVQETGEVAYDFFHAAEGGNVHTCHQKGNWKRVADWRASQLSHFKYMVERMDALGLLSQSLITLTGDMSSSNEGHHGCDLPMVTAGTLGGKVRTGQLISFYRDFIRESNGQTVHHTGIVAHLDQANYKNYYMRAGRRLNEYWISCMKAAGLSEPDYELSPGAGFGTYDCGNSFCSIGRINSPLNEYYKKYSISKNATLPYLFSF